MSFLSVEAIVMGIKGCTKKKHCLHMMIRSLKNDIAINLIKNTQEIKINQYRITPPLNQENTKDNGYSISNIVVYSINIGN